MGLIHHVVTGAGGMPLVFVHGFGCAHDDWAAQVAYFSRDRRTVAVDLRGHGSSRGGAADCSVERYGGDVAEVMRALDLPPSVVVGHSMGCRVVTEAALQAPERVAGVVLVDGSQFAAAMGAVLRARFAEPGGYAAVVDDLFEAMFTPRSAGDVVASVMARAQRLPPAIGVKMLTDMQRYDTGRLSASLGCLRVPVMALQTTFSNDKRERRTMQAGQTTPYLEMVRASVPSVQVAVIPDTGHFPQIDESERTNALIGGFVGGLSAG